MFSRFDIRVTRIIKCQVVSESTYSNIEIEAKDEIKKALQVPDIQRDNSRCLCGKYPIEIKCNSLSPPPPPQGSTPEKKLVKTAVRLLKSYPFFVVV